jgi:hypothetical protein
MQSNNGGSVQRPRPQMNDLRSNMQQRQRMQQQQQQQQQQQYQPQYQPQNQSQYGGGGGAGGGGNGQQQMGRGGGQQQQGGYGQPMQQPMPQQQQQQYGQNQMPALPQQYGRGGGMNNNDGPGGRMAMRQQQPQPQQQQQQQQQQQLNGRRPPISSPRNVAPARQGGGRSGKKVRQRERNMAYQKIGMDGATTASASNRRPESFHSAKSPRTMQRTSNQRNAALAEGGLTAQLAFSKKARHVDWQPKTMKEYRRLQPKEYVELGKLPADLNSPHLIQKVS